MVGLISAHTRNLTSLSPSSHTHAHCGLSYVESFTIARSISNASRVNFFRLVAFKFQHDRLFLQTFTASTCKLGPEVPASDCIKKGYREIVEHSATVTKYVQNMDIVRNWHVCVGIPIRVWFEDLVEMYPGSLCREVGPGSDGLCELDAPEGVPYLVLRVGEPSSVVRAWLNSCFTLARLSSSWLFHKRALLIVFYCIVWASVASAVFPSGWEYWCDMS